jgi:hypothetical protein
VRAVFRYSIIPGGAYFYARQTGLGALHAIVDSFITLEVLLTLAAAFSLKPQQRTADFWLGFGVIIFVWLLERSIALWHARRFLREFIPMDGTVPMQSAVAAR